MPEAALKPTVSVIIPAFRVAPFIRETLDSVLSQTYTDYEAIVINDGSPDTEELERNLEPYRDKIIYLKQENQGAGAARNAGLRVARGRYVAFLDGDDVWLPIHLEEQIRLIESDGGFDLVYSDSQNLTESGLGATCMEVNPSQGPVTFESLVNGRCSVITSTVLARREVIDRVGLFAPQFRNSQDFDLWLRVAKEPGARLTYSTVITARRRLYEGSLASDPIKSLQGEVAVLQNARLRPGLTESERRTVEDIIGLRGATIEVLRGKRLLLTGDFEAARLSFASAHRYFRGWKLRIVLVALKVAPRFLQFAYRLNPS
jgi:glycosyltransferase involved in cell wall biosynthesis